VWVRVPFRRPAIMRRERLGADHFAGLFSRSSGARRSCLAVLNAEIGNFFKVGLGGFGIVGPERNRRRALHCHHDGRPLAPKSRKFADAVEGEDPIIHIYAA